MAGGDGGEEGNGLSAAPNGKTAGTTTPPDSTHTTTPALYTLIPSASLDITLPHALVLNERREDAPEHVLRQRGRQTADDEFEPRGG
jgi:hypothetical protein